MSQTSFCFETIQVDLTTNVQLLSKVGGPRCLLRILTKLKSGALLLDKINLVQVEKLRRTSARQIMLLTIRIKPYEALWDVVDFYGERTGLDAFDEGLCTLFSWPH